MTRMYKYLTTAVVALCMAFIAGCGERLPATSTVLGKVTVGGKPVTAGQITFLPAEGRPATGTIGADGTYRLTTFRPNDGAVIGKHKVMIQATRITGAEQPKSFQEELQSVGKSTGVPKLEWLVPEKYSRQDSTPLTAEVKPGNNVIDFDL